MVRFRAWTLAEANTIRDPIRGVYSITSADAAYTGICYMLLYASSEWCRLLWPVTVQAWQGQGIPFCRKPARLENQICTGGSEQDQRAHYCPQTLTRLFLVSVLRCCGAVQLPANGIRLLLYVYRQ